MISVVVLMFTLEETSGVFPLIDTGLTLPFTALLWVWANMVGRGLDPDEISVVCSICFDFPPFSIFLVCLPRRPVCRPFSDCGVDGEVRGGTWSDMADDL